MWFPSTSNSVAQWFYCRGMCDWHLVGIAMKNTDIHLQCLQFSLATSWDAFFSYTSPSSSSLSLSAVRRNDPSHAIENIVAEHENSIHFYIVLFIEIALSHAVQCFSYATLSMPPPAPFAVVVWRAVVVLTCIVGLWCCTSTEVVIVVFDDNSEITGMPADSLSFAFTTVSSSSCGSHLGDVWNSNGHAFCRERIE